MRYEFRKLRYGLKELRDEIQSIIGRPPDRCEVGSYDSEGNITEFTLIFETPLTPEEEEALQAKFPKLRMIKTEERIEGGEG